MSQLFSGASASFTNDGDIITDATGDPSASSIDVLAVDDATVVNSGYVLTYSHDDSNVEAVDVYSAFGLASVENLESGSILGSSYFGNAIGVHADGYDAQVTNAGFIAGASLTGNATGVYAYAFDASCGQHGHIQAYTLTGDTTAVEPTRALATRTSPIPETSRPVAKAT